MNIYKHEHVEAVQDFYGDLLSPIYLNYSVQKHLGLLAEKLGQAIEDKNPIMSIELSNYHPQYLGLSFEVLLERKVSRLDAFQCIASQYGFEDWQELEKLGSKSYDRNFETVLTDLLAGDFVAVKKAIQDAPDLLRMRSLYGHQANLLHYTASNGVELWRQQVPKNLPQITEFLLASGAAPTSNMKVYGGSFSPLALLSSSAHPYDAGIMEEMKAIFLRYQN